MEWIALEIVVVMMIKDCDCCKEKIGQRRAFIEDEYNQDMLTGFWLCLSCYNDAVNLHKVKEVRVMAGKIPSHDLVVGKRNVGAIWDSESKKGLKYNSGYLDISAIKELASDETVTKPKTVKNKDGSTREIQAMRIAVFKRTPKEQKASW